MKSLIYEKQYMPTTAPEKQQHLQPQSAPPSPYDVSISLDRPIRISEQQIRSPTDVYSLMQHTQHLDREAFYCLHLDARHALLSRELVHMGTLNASLVHPREVFKAAILRSAAAIIVSHNHPSGDPAPSADDLSLTNRLKDAGQLIGIEVLDHVIIGNNCFYSFTDEALTNMSSHSTK